MIFEYYHGKPALYISSFNISWQSLKPNTERVAGIYDRDSNFITIDKLAIWAKENSINISYIMNRVTLGVFVMFEDENSAMIFKTRWG